MRRFSLRRASARAPRVFSTFPAMSIPTGGLAALLVVATLALSSCGSDNGSVITTTTVTPGSAAATATQTVAAETTPEKTTTQQTTQTTAPKPAQTTTQKTQTTAPAPKPAATTTKPSSACPSVDVGAREGDVDETYARITSVSKTNCALVTFVVQQWGGQKIGVGKALLPDGWHCSGTTCSKGDSSVSFKLEFPSS